MTTEVMRYLVVGAAGHGQEVAWSLREQERAAGRRCELLFFDDRVPPGPVASSLGEVVGTLDDVVQFAGRGDVRLVLGVGLPRVKVAVVERLAPFGLPWASAVHPAAVIGPQVTIGEGTYVAASAVVTVNARLGRFVTVNVHCAVTHDDVLEDFASLHPDAHLSGNVRVGEGAELGTGALVIPGATVGAWTVVGAGAVVVRSLPGHRTYVGMPAVERARSPALEP